ncbi:MAG: hypothetical protein ONB27_11405 [candidate division KSB1 bacterium]|nr:hypothetical protein [candidate division KSB1 bacterium]
MKGIPNRQKKVVVPKRVFKNDPAKFQKDKRRGSQPAPKKG